MYNSVVGLRRSGTSLLMLALRQAGIPIIGVKYTYVVEADNGQVSIYSVPDNKLREANPNGFWELGNITIKTGIQPMHKDLGMDGDIAKLVPEALYASEPDMINKVVIIMRNPRKSLQSMLDTNSMKEEELEQEVKNNVIFLKEGFKWLKDNNKEYITATYENLLENPEEELKKITDFIGRGDYKLGAKVVDKKLNRSKELTRNFKALEELEEIYNKIAKIK